MANTLATGVAPGLATRLAGALERCFFEPTRARAPFLIRAGLGAIVTFHYLRLAPHVLTLYGPGGINGLETAERWPRFPMLATEGFERFDLLATISDPTIVLSLYWALIVSGALFAIGLATRSAGIAMIALHVVFAAHQPDLTGGWAKLLPAFALYVVLTPSGRALSVDAWWAARRGRRVADPYLIRPWPLRLLQVHVVTMYMVAGWPRLTRAAWLRGEQVFHAVVDTRFGRWDVDWYAMKPLLVAASYYAFALEPLATLLLPWRRTRRWCALALIALHLGIELLADVGMWHFLMVTVVLAFLPEPWLAKFPGLGPWNDDHGDPSGDGDASGDPSEAPSGDPRSGRSTHHRGSPPTGGIARILGGSDARAARTIAAPCSGPYSRFASFEASCSSRAATRS